MTLKSKLSLLSLLGVLLLFQSCGVSGDNPPTSSSGVQKANVTVQTDLNGHTSEQNNVITRYQRDNQPGSIKYLYLISPFTGQVVLASSVKGKVTSSGKRLTPLSISGSYGSNYYGFPVDIGGQTYYTTEVLQDDGTYGNSIEYLYWFDTKGVYHQEYAHGLDVHISDQPIHFKEVLLNLDVLEAKADSTK